MYFLVKRDDRKANFKTFDAWKYHFLTSDSLFIFVRTPLTNGRHYEAHPPSPLPSNYDTDMYNITMTINLLVKCYWKYM